MTRLSPEEIRHNLEQHIERQKQHFITHGFSLSHVFPTEGSPDHNSFTYTVGLSRKTGYELIVESMPPAVAAFVLNTVGRMAMQDKGAVYNMARFDDVVNLPIWALDASGTDGIFDEYVTGPQNHGLFLYRVFVIAWPDETGRPPWDAAYSEKFRGKQLIAERAIEGGKAG